MTKKDIRILAFESSCDETSTAVIKNGREIESLIVATQIKSHQRFGGVVPEVASRHHIEVITQITKEALAEANATWDDIDAIAVTYGPGLVGALLIGVSAAKAASMATGIPLIGVDHIMGHIMAAQLKDEIEYPALALQVSGGHTEIVLMKDPIHFEIAFINTCHHADQIHEKLDKYDLAASFQASVVDVLSHKTIRAIKEYKPKTFILGGGVAANHGLRDRLAEGIEKLPADIKPKVILPDLKLCGDNAAMIGAAAYNLYKAGKFSDENLNADPSLELPYAESMLK